MWPFQVPCTEQSGRAGGGAAGPLLRQLPPGQGAPRGLFHRPGPLLDNIQGKLIVSAELVGTVFINILSKVEILRFD